MWTLLLLTFIFLSVNSLSNSRYDDHIRKDLTGNVPKGTCLNNCGNFTTCSCQTNCKIHGTCCKDFQEVCPSLVRKSQVEFQHFVERIGECERSRYLLISKCPSNEDEQLRPMLDKTDEDSITIFTTLQKVSSGHGLEAYLFGNTPLTDLDSGLTFKNATIYLCNNFSGKNFVFWDIYMEAIELDGQGMLEFESLTRIMSNPFPSLQLTGSSKNTLCIYDFEILPDFKIVEIKNSSKLKSSLLRGFESLCHLCDWSSQQSTNEKKDVGRDFFPVIASLEYDKVKFFAQEHASKKPLPWQEIHCPIVNSIRENGTSCHIVSCYIFFEKMSSSRCQNTYIFHIAIPHDGRSIGKHFLKKLPYFLECYLNQYSGYNVKNRWPVSELFYNLHSQQVFYATQLLMYSDTFLDIWDESEIFDHITRLANVITILKSFRSSVLAKERRLAQLKEQARVATFDIIRNDDVKKVFNDDPFFELVCANIVDKENLKFPAFYLRLFHCANVPIKRSYNVTDVHNYTETNKCFEIFAFSGQFRKGISFIVLINVILFHFVWA